MSSTRTLDCDSPGVHSVELSDDARELSYVTEDGDQLVVEVHKFKHVRHGPDNLETFGSDETLPAVDGDVVDVDLAGNPWLMVEDENGNEHMHVYRHRKTRSV